MAGLRRNQTFAELGEDFGLAASTAWEYYQLITDLLADVLGSDVRDLCESVRGKICWSTGCSSRYSTGATTATCSRASAAGTGGLSR